MNQQHIALAPHRLVLSAQIDILEGQNVTKGSDLREGSETTQTGIRVCVGY